MISAWLLYRLGADQEGVNFSLLTTHPSAFKILVAIS